jgi:hypothetical protein
MYKIISKSSHRLKNRMAKIPTYSGRFLWQGGEIPFRRFPWPRFLKEIP